MKQWQADRLEGLFSSKKGEYALVFLFFLLMAIVFTWPLILHFHNGVLGGHGDPLLNSWIISWNAKTIFTNPSGLFQANIMYPARDVLAYSEHLFTLGLLTAPVYYIFHNPILSYNFLVFFGFVLSGFGCYLLIKELTGSRWAGLAGGLFFALCPYKISKFSHLQIMFSPFLPFMLLYLYRYLRKGGRKNAILFGVFFLAQSLSSWHYLVFCSLAAGLMWLWTAIFSRGKEEWMRLVWAIITLVVAVVLIIPFALPYLKAHSRLPGFERPISEVKGYAAEGEDYLTVLPESLIYGEAPSPFHEGGIGYEMVLYPGVIILVLALAGLFIRRREEDTLTAFNSNSFRRGLLFFLVLAVVSFLLTLGPEVRGVGNPLYTIPYNLGLLKFIRVPARFYVLLALALAVLGGYGVAKIVARSGGPDSPLRKVRITALVLLLLLVFELLTFNLYVFPVPVYGDVPEVYNWLSEQEDVRIIELPTSPLRGVAHYDRYLDLIPWNTDEYFSHEGMLIYMSTYHFKQMVNGYSGYFPYFYNRIMTEMQGFSSQRCLDLLSGLGVEYVIWDWYWVPRQRLEEYNCRLFDTPGLTFVEDFEDKSVFRVEPREMATAADLEVEAVVPSIILPEKAFNTGITVSNTTDLPYVDPEEEPQPFRLRFLDGQGNVVMEEEGDYRAPFFLEAGESAPLAVRVERAPPTGTYTLELYIYEGVLGEHQFSFPVRVMDMPDSQAPGLLEGELAYQGNGEVTIPVPDGLLPLVFRVENNGDTYWITAREDKDAEKANPVGLVHLAMRWEYEDGPIWEEQRGTLPCDTAPGQSVMVHTLIRPPSAPGKYRLFVGLADEGFQWFGEVQVLEVEIESWLEEETTDTTLSEAA